MNENTWGLQFVRVNVQDNQFETLLILKGVSEEYAKETFERIKSEFVKNQGEPDCVVDLLNEEDSIVDDFAITLVQAKTIASLLGHSITE
ncbi:uncharacterized protein with FMN-binding domain [Paenibacillus sp. PastF-3]|uniref:hypothetical protein n=1 Tax=Paenibacillus sp. PastF-3 TaxID=2940626 RepID=UPI002473B356|nr:hypothetical protein [Paenibacillus sp. PastF-3]MDH6370572.1 uncharacterized protein with FMN-binding domain [Paenibacillus sp. PastF-3]